MAQAGQARSQGWRQFSQIRVVLDCGQILRTFCIASDIALPAATAHRPWVQAILPSHIASRSSARRCSMIPLHRIRAPDQQSSFSASCFCCYSSNDRGYDNDPKSWGAGAELLPLLRLLARVMLARVRIVCHGCSFLVTSVSFINSARSRYYATQLRVFFNMLDFRRDASCFKTVVGCAGKAPPEPCLAVARLIARQFERARTVYF